MSADTITLWTFRLADPDIAQVSVGASPRVTVGPAGFQTTDAKLADRLQRYPELVLDGESQVAALPAEAQGDDTEPETEEVPE